MTIQRGSSYLTDDSDTVRQSRVNGLTFVKSHSHTVKLVTEAKFAPLSNLESKGENEAKEPIRSFTLRFVAFFIHPPPLVLHSFTVTTIMRTVALLVALLAVLAVVAAQQRGGGECAVPGERARPCPTYTYYPLGERSEGRRYDSFTLIETTEETHNFVRAIGEAFPELDAYIHGRNVNRTDLGERRIPVVVGIEPRIRQNVSTSLILPEAFTHRAPRPDSPSLHVRTTPPGLHVYSHTFYYGYINDDERVYEALRFLVRELDNQRPPRRFVEGIFLFADYDPPSVRQDRRYEVWLFAEEQDKQNYEPLRNLMSRF